MTEWLDANQDKVNQLTSYILSDPELSSLANKEQWISLMRALGGRTEKDLCRNKNFLYHYFEVFGDSIDEKLNFLTILNNIPGNLFAYDKFLEKIKIPANITYIFEGAFQHCSYLERVIFEKDSALMGISNKVFAECHSLVEIELPEGVRTLGDFVFDGCKSLKDVTLPSSITTLGGYLFASCNYLKEIEFAGTQEQFEKIDNGIWDRLSSIEKIHCSDDGYFEYSNPI